MVSSPTCAFESGPPPTLYMIVKIVFAGVSPIFKLFVPKSLIGALIEVNDCPFNSNPACSIVVNILELEEPVTLYLYNPLPNINLVEFVSTSKLVTNFLFVLI